jgi:hypothetical protein
MKSPRTSLGYDVVVASLPTPALLQPGKFYLLQVEFRLGFLEEQPIVDCAEHIDELHVPHMPEFEHVVTDDIVVDMSGCSTHVSELDPEPTSSSSNTKKYVPYHHPHHKNRRNGNHAFRYLQKRHENINCGPVSTTRIDCGWIDGWSWNHLTICLRTSYRCVSSVVQSCNIPLTY